MSRAMPLTNKVYEPKEGDYEQLPARGVMTAAERRTHQQAKPVWTGNLAMGFRTMWRGLGVTVSRVDKPKSNASALPSHLRPAVVKRTARARASSIIVSGNQSAITASPKSVDKQLDKASRNAQKSTIRANRQARERNII